MRLPTFRIVDLLEWVVALAVGLATFRACFALPIWRLQWERAEIGLVRLALFIASTLFGVAIFEGVVLAVGRARGRGPRPWGIGRWTWSIAAIYVVLKVASDLANIVLAMARTIKTLPDCKALSNYFSYYLASAFSAQFACALAAFLITARLTGLTTNPSPDAREWSGRVFAVLVIGWPVAMALVGLDLILG